MKITNNFNISLSLAVWLVHDEYDYVNEPNYISVTTLMKPLRHIILPRRIPRELVETDVSDFIARALGHSLHDSIEKSWVKGYKRSLALLGYPEKVIERVLINPTPEELASTPNAIPIYLEQRAKKAVVVNGKTWTVGGKFDMVAEGIVHDNKSTSAYTWVYGGRDEEHQQQGSLYRWLNPDKITEDFIRINYIFTDWQKAQARQNPNYPQKRVESKDIVLLSEAEIQRWVEWKLQLVMKYWDAPERDIPNCTDEELWMSDPKFKYYADPAKTSGRSTKNFDSLLEANAFKAEKGNKGVILTIPGEPKRCDYCDAFSICSQKDKYQK
jgi:hypothetical protein